MMAKCCFNNWLHFTFVNGIRKYSCANFRKGTFYETSRGQLVKIFLRNDSLKRILKTPSSQEGLEWNSSSSSLLAFGRTARRRVRRQRRFDGTPARSIFLMAHAAMKCLQTALSKNSILNSRNLIQNSILIHTLAKFLVRKILALRTN